MSAIFGLVYLDDRPVEQTELDLMASALVAHGPDSGATWKHGSIGIGQRLMRITPEDFLEHQPAVSCGGRHVLVSDARIDNRPELREELGITATDAGTMPDSAYILRAYEKWGADCPGHLIGAFAFALWDGSENQILIARSPMGERSLFYCVTSRFLTFASAPRGLFALPFVPRELDEQSIADYLVMMPREPGRSLFAGVKRLEGGHLLAIRGEKCDERQYWHPDLKKQTEFARDDEYVDAFNSLFERVIADQVRSTTGVAVMMSGGLDSTAIAAVAAERRGREGKRLPTFTEVPRHGFDAPTLQGKYADETPLVQAMARRYENIDLHLIRTEGRFYVDDIDVFFDAAESPFRNASNRPWWEAIIQESSRRQIRVMLTGIGGNLTISWDGKGLLPGLLRQGCWLRAVHEARAMARHEGRRSTLSVLLGSGILPLLSPGAWLAIQRLRPRKNPVISAHQPWEAYSPVNPQFARDQHVSERARASGHNFSFRPKGDFRQARYRTLRNNMGSDIDRGYQALHGVETRNPAGDVRLVEFCLSLPENQALRDGSSRFLLRRAMSHRLPPEVLANTGRGLQAADWFDSLRDARHRAAGEVALLASNPLANRVLDLRRAQSLMEKLNSPGSDPVQSSLNYRNVLERCIMTGRFLRWFGQSAQ